LRRAARAVVAVAARQRAVGRRAADKTTQGPTQARISGPVMRINSHLFEVGIIHEFIGRRPMN
jgi:hypothetical protein